MYNFIVSASLITSLIHYFTHFFPLYYRKGKQCFQKQIHVLECRVWFRSLDLLCNHFSGDGRLNDPTFPLQPQFKEPWWAGRLAGIDNWLSEAAITIGPSVVIERMQPSAKHNRYAEMAVFAVAARAASPQSWAVLTDFWWKQAMLKAGNHDSL